MIVNLTLMNIVLLARDTLHFATADRQWVVTAYSLAVVSLLCGVLTERATRASGRGRDGRWPYAAYEVSRGVVAGRPALAERYAGEVVSIERSLHVFVEGEVQRAADHVVGLASTLGVAYLTLHLALTVDGKTVIVPELRLRSATLERGSRAACAT
jgi:hypothetical protein